MPRSPKSGLRGSTDRRRTFAVVGDSRRSTQGTICVLGLGPVGLGLAAAFAARGLKVIGVDKNQQLIDDLIRVRTRHPDECLAAAVAAAPQLKFAASLPQATAARTYVVAVGTPANADHSFVHAQLDEAVAGLAAQVQDGDLVVMRSTVPLGTTRAMARRLAEVADVDVASCPDRSIAGDVFNEVHRLPQVVGGMTDRARTRAAQLFAKLGVEIVLVDTIEAAEAVKLVANVQRDVLFALANEVAMMCDATGLDAHHVIDSNCRGYPRHILPRPGPVGGPCLTKDAFLLAHGLARYGVRLDIVMTARAVNSRVSAHVAAFIVEYLARCETWAEGPVIAVLGIAFKGRPETGSVDGSVAGPLRAAIAEQLPQSSFRGWDPIAEDHDVASLGFTACRSAAEAAAGASALVLANDHPAIAALPLDALARKLRRPALIYDLWGWRRAAGRSLPNQVVYRAFGGHAGQASPVRNGKSDSGRKREDTTRAP
jgi:UDP-N-acetyl-D-mannosaminuronic acid dehydrogenase